MLASLLLLQASKLLKFGVYHILAVIIVFVIVANAIYNRYFHPLHKFPGPFWGSVTDLYNTYLLSTRQVHVKQLRLHEQYGEYRGLHVRGN